MTEATASSRTGRPALLRALGLIAGLSLLALSPAHAQERHKHGHSHATAQAHVHGNVELAVAIEGPAIVIEMRAPLDSIVGFERAPRNDVEKNTVDQAVSRLRAADHLFKLDPAGNCKLGPVAFDAPVLGLGASAAAPAAPAASATTKSGEKEEEHAELVGSFAFNCTSAEQVKFIELDLFQAFSRMRQIDAEIVSAEGQHKRSLKRPATRLTWTP